MKKYSFLIGIVIFILIISRLDLHELILVLNDINYFYLFLGFLLSFPILTIKVYRWNYLMKKQNINYSFKESVLMYGSGMYIGIITPGRLGDFTKIAYLKNNHRSLGESAVSVILDRALDLFFLAIFGYLGLFFFFSLFTNLIYILTFILILSLILLAVFLKTNSLKLLLKKIFNLFVPVKYQKSWKLNLRDFISGLKNYKVNDYLFTFLITSFSWLFYYFQTFILIKSVNIDNISFLYASVAITIVGLAGLLPISILGLGTREAILILLFSFFSISQEATISFSFLTLLMAVLIGLICSICWLIRPIRFSKIC
ncbi:MAG: lysylphosphatidylglycerol synthase transmembrane domain-containing protein [Candidatus Portnoybacteria bacterium]